MMMLMLMLLLQWGSSICQFLNIHGRGLSSGEMTVPPLRRVANGLDEDLQYCWPCSMMTAVLLDAC